MPRCFICDEDIKDKEGIRLIVKNKIVWCCLYCEDSYREEENESN